MAESFHSLITEQTIPNPALLLSNPHAEIEENLETNSDDGHSDIYRGSEPPSPRLSFHSIPPSIAASSSSSSSSSSWGRLRGFAQVVSALENALSRWAGSSTSNSSTSSDSSQSTKLAKRRRRKRYPGSIYSIQSELDFAARISLIKARAVSRQTPRHFSLYIPPSAHSTSKTTTSGSLQDVLHELEVLLRRTSKARKMKGREEAPQPPQSVHHHFMLPVPDVAAPSRPASFTDLTALLAGRKGKAKESPEPGASAQPTQASLPAWFLDVASPSWDDMRAIGRLLHLHPLTLEDILHKERREKLEVFPKLGYSFISFRAIENKTIRENARENKLDTITDEDEERLLGETNVYLIIFNEGICLFHFTDISEHTERVRNKLISFAESSTMSSAWIAHGLLDSIVDSFFPCLDDIEKEVVAIEELVFNGERPSQAPPTQAQVQTQPSNQPEDTPPTKRKWLLNPTSLFSRPNPSEHPSSLEKADTFSEKDETDTYRDSLATKTRFDLPRPPMALMKKRLRRFFRSRFKLSKSKSEKSSPPSMTYINLKRIARTRKIVTTLTRLLASKADVIAQIRKRMLSGIAGTSPAEDVEVAIYMGDVQDHILTLQHSLTHYERMLSQSYPIYLRQLQIESALAKFGSDKALIFLTTISIAILVGQSVIGPFSMNVNVPHNGNADEDMVGGPYNLFGIVLAMVTTGLILFLMLVRWWWWKAKRRRGLVLKNR
ncbi:hypothetical protein V5O48_005612 [Marasmius crinis-equi]|uniref:Uncharacterized protein n=1 Tax=Marasmius crinis-equi TaxID=585013 RepID=A0ABR3FM06_9AGAR